jgi:uncharacterized protein (DUF433 family)
MSITAADSQPERITITQGVRSGQPIIRGTRTTVADILGWLAAGAPENEILTDYPWLQADDIKAALAYAARELRQRKAR